jgi:hypothetical protein
MGLFERLFEPEEEDAASATWPTVTGEIYNADVQGGPRNGYKAEIAYSYSVEDEYYSGYFQKDFYDCEDEANQFVAPLRPGSKVLVHYRPDKPEVSTLFEQDINVES